MISLLLNLLISIVFLYFLFLNNEQMVSIFLLDKSLLTVPLFVLLGITFIVAQCFAGVSVYAVSQSQKQQSQQKSQNKYVEKISVDKESAELRVQVLEEKIKTLEVALDKALKNK